MPQSKQIDQPPKDTGVSTPENTTSNVSSTQDSIIPLGHVITSHLSTHKEENPMAGIAFDVIAGLIIALISWAASQLWAQRRLNKKIEAAPEIYVQEIDKLIKRAVKEGPENAIINARAIVVARNSMRNSLVTISSQLNSEIDRLAEEVGIGGVSLANLRTTSRDKSENSINQEVAYQTIQVLSRIWPGKKRQIVIEMRKVLTEMGFETIGSPFNDSPRNRK